MKFEIAEQSKTRAPNIRVSTLADTYLSSHCKYNTSSSFDVKYICPSTKRHKKKRLAHCSFLSVEIYVPRFLVFEVSLRSISLCALSRAYVCVCVCVCLPMCTYVVQCAQSWKQTIKGKKARGRVSHSGIRGSINLNFHEKYFQLCVSYQLRFEIEGKQRL